MKTKGKSPVRPARAQAEAGFSLPPRKRSGKGACLLAHGAGGHKDHPHMSALADALSDAGLEPHRFNFPYRDEGRSFPDRLPALVERYRVEAERFASAKRSPILAGHSMGTRAAVALAASGFPCRGLILFSYPLHPPGHPEKLRLDHLEELRVPVLSISGSRDAFCTPKLMDNAVGGLRGWTHHWIEAADHGLAVPKASGRTRGEVMEEVADTVRAWLKKNAKEK